MIESLQHGEVEDFEVEPENWETVSIFLAVETQWRIGFSGPTGLDYSALKSVMEVYGVADMRAVFAGVRTMETAALEEMNAKRGD